MNFTVLIEEDFANRNFSGYIPELRISAVADSEEELAEVLRDLIMIEVENHNKALPAHRFKIQSLASPCLKGDE